MLKIRLQRVGRKHDPSFRVVLTDSRSGPKSLKHIEMLGSYDARGGRVPSLKGERITHWIAKGAQVSDTVHNLLIKNKVIRGKKIAVASKKNAGKKQQEEANAAVPAQDVNGGTTQTSPTETAAEEKTSDAAVSGASSDEVMPEAMSAEVKE
ncbi:MAG: 30S ribosomal protein S16 [Parcubacteria group bacterium]|nr:30S ribosomal protein S16 [Parcubacteria group bacterium]